MITFPWMAMPLLLCNKGCVPEMDSSKAVEVERMRVICFEVRFFTNTGAGVPEDYDKTLVKKGEDRVAMNMMKHRGAHMLRLLQAAHVLARDYGGALTQQQWPEEWNLLREEVAADADPQLEHVRKTLEPLVEPGLLVKKGEQYTDYNGKTMVAKNAPVVDKITLQDLVTLVTRGRDVPRAANNKSVKAADWKVKVQAYMVKERGFKFAKDTTVCGENVKLSFVGCRLVRPRDPLQEVEGGMY
jgi:hypothetical protein